MTRDDVIRMARGAGGYVAELPNGDAWLLDDAVLERFAALVAAAEREACAKDAEWCIQNHLEHLMPERIRARSNP